MPIRPNFRARLRADTAIEAVLATAAVAAHVAWLDHMRPVSGVYDPDAGNTRLVKGDPDFALACRIADARAEAAK